MRKTKILSAFAMITTCSAALMANSAAAQSDKPSDAGSGALADIIVTAQKRSESVQKIPLAVTAVSAEALVRSDVKDLSGLQSMVPSLNIGTTLGIARVNLRGIGLENITTGSEGSIAVHLDGVYVARTAAALTSFYDIERVEVLRGPQGTLYGRNATGGAINIIPKQPTEEVSGYLNLTTGNYGTFNTSGALSGAIIPGVLQGRVAFQTQKHNGYGKNIVTGSDIDDQDTWAARIMLKFTPTDRLTIDLSADKFREDDRLGGYHYAGPGGFTAPGVVAPVKGLLPVWGGVVATNIRDIANETDPSNTRNFRGVRGGITYDFGGVELKYIGAYRRTVYHTTTDLDSTSARLALTLQQEDSKENTHELQLSGKTDRLNWLLGLYSFHEVETGFVVNPLDPGILSTGPRGFLAVGSSAAGTIRAKALAAFGQLTYEVVDNLRLTVGARYSHDKKTIDRKNRFSTAPLTPGFDYFTSPGFTPDHRTKKWNKPTYRVALDYQATPDTLIYGSISTGFKAGVYSVGSLSNAVNPEKVVAYEAGLKSSWLDRRVRTNIAGFYYDYTDLQIGKVVGTAQLLENAANAEIYGIEFEGQVQIAQGLEADGNISWLHARFKDYTSGDPSRAFLGQIDLSGNTLSQAPNFTSFLGLQYTGDTEIGSFRLRSEWAHSGVQYFTPFNVPQTRQGRKDKVNMYLNFTSRDENWHAQFFVKNLLDKTTKSNAFISTGLLGYPVNSFLDPPRTYGVTIGYDF